MVRTTTRVCGHSWRRRSINLMLLPPGMVRSRVSTSGWVSRAARSAAATSAASPTTCMSGWASSSKRRPARRTAWSSASSTRILAMIFLQGDADADRGSVPRVRGDADPPVQQGRALAHAGQAELSTGSLVVVEAPAVVADDHLYEVRLPLDDDADSRRLGVLG